MIAWFLGAVLWELIVDGPFWGNANDRLSFLWGQIQMEYDLQNSQNRLGQLTFSMFYHGSSSFTCLTAKAGESLTLLYVLRSICCEFSTGSLRDRHRIACFECLCYIFDACKNHGARIPLDIAHEMQNRCDGFLLHYHWLAKCSEHRLELNYNFTFKCHFLWHIVYYARYLNPRLSWCYEFEDFVGVMILCAKSCMAGTPLRLVGNNCLENFLLVLQLRLSR